MRTLVVTIVHNPADARILQRQISALVRSGHQVTYAAPFAAFGTERPDGLRCIDLPRASGRDRLAAVRAARRMIRTEAREHDIVLIHDPELLVSVAGIKDTPIVWDVHEDTAAALSLKPWLPKVVRPAVAATFRRVERAVERRHHLILAETGYLPRFDADHLVVPNSTPVPAEVLPSGDERVVYVGHLTAARGVVEMIELGALLGPDGPRVHLVGAADSAAEEQLKSAAAKGTIIWHGFLPNTEALAIVDGALAGLSPLHDEPNYRHSRPTKIIEYMAHGVPTITTPTPPARELVEGAGCGIVVPFNDVGSVAVAVHQLLLDPEARQAMADRGRLAALQAHDWTTDSQEFVRQLEVWAAGGSQ
jgi:glycosyltransferase involved in cell wall biosynthesis